MNKPIVSVIIPVHNRAKLVLETLSSLKIQSFQNWECIIVDDYSNSETVRLIKDFILLDNRYRLIEKTFEKKGAPSSRNIGWKNASSKWIVFLDSDDLLAPWALEKRISFISEKKDLDFALFSNVEFNSGFNKFLNLRVKYNEDDHLKSFLSFESTWQTSSPIWNKNFLIKINGWDENVTSWQDGEIHIRALLLNPNFKWNETILPDYFLRLEGEEKISNVINVSKRINNINTYKGIYKLLPKKYKAVFQLNVKTIIYNRIENLEKEFSYKYINDSDLNFFGISYNKLRFYISIYNNTKSIPGLRKLVYLIREKTTFFSKRKTFFQKTKLDKENLDLLREKLTGFELYSKNFQF